MALPIDPASLASLASLQGTLSTPEGVLTLSEALHNRVREESARRTAQATQDAQQAGAAYQQAAAAPVETPDALASLIPLLTGNIASVIAQDPSFAKRGSEEVKQRRDDLVRTRVDNLVALKDAYDKKAMLAAHLGDQEMEIEQRTRSEQLSKTLEVLMQNQRLNVGSAEAEKNRKTDLEIARIRSQGSQAPAGDSDEVEHWVNLLTTGQATLPNVPQKIRTAVVGRLAETGEKILPPKVRQTVNDLGAAESVMDTIESLVGEVNTGGPKLSRVKQGIKSTVKGVLQTDNDDALYDQTMRGFLATIARSTGEKGVLTDRDSERARNLLPHRFDAKNIAAAKVQQLRQFVRGQKLRTMHNFTATSSELVNDPWRSNTWFAREDGKVYVKRKTDGRTGWIDPEDADRRLFIPATPELPKGAGNGK